MILFANKPMRDKIKLAHDWAKKNDAMIKIVIAAIGVLISSAGTYYYKVKADEKDAIILTYERFFANDLASVQSHHYFNYAHKIKLSKPLCWHDSITRHDVERTKAIATFCLEWLRGVEENTLQKRKDFRTQLYSIINIQNELFHMKILQDNITHQQLIKFNAMHPNLDNLLETLSGNCNGGGVVGAYLDIKLAIHERDNIHSCDATKHNASR